MSKKYDFLIKAIIGCMLLTKIHVFSLNSSIYPYLFSEFTTYFSMVLLFWLIIPKDVLPFNWILVGFFGSLTYSSGTFLVSYMFYNYPISLLSEFIVFEKFLFGIVGSLPFLIVLKKKVLLWLIANGIGFGMINIPYYFLGHNANFIYFSFLLGYGLLGLFLGLYVNKYILQKE